ncbi:MAG: hypothetical protein COB66_02935 [Coxiella sp. (in: Bacteria)]|nr:MAG: hypothetical protein COB66_02935 [Coxiella sp. (in: g-proteobacteria)]
MLNKQQLAGFCVLLAVTPTFAAQVPGVTVKHNAAKAVSLTTPSDVQVISQQQIKASGASNISQVLASQSSLQLQDLTGDGSRITVGMRGFGGNAGSNTLILINGVPQNNPDLATTELNQIPLSNVERIVIMPGSQSVLFGDQAVAGAINIITKDPKKPNANVSQSYGSYHHQIYNFNVSDAYKNGFNYYLGGSKDMTNNYRDHNKDDQANLHLNLGYKYASGLVKVFYNFYHQNLQYAGPLKAGQEAQNRRQEEPGSPNNFTHETHHALTLNWKQLITPHWNSNMALSYRDFSANGQLYGAFTQSRRVFYFGHSFEGDLGSAKLTFGNNFSHDNYRLDAVSNNDQDNESQYDMGLYSLWKQALGKSVTFDFGARVAHFINDSTAGSTDFSGSAFVTSQALSWHVNKNSALYVRRSGNYRFPKAEENAYRQAGVNHLRTQTGSSYDLGYKYITDRFHADINVYYMRLKNEIVLDPTKTETQPFGFNRNLAPTDRKGVNLGASYTLNPHLTVGGQYSFTDAVFRSGNFKGKKIPFVAENTFHLSSTINVEEHWTLFMESIFTGHRYASGDDANAGTGIPAFVVFNSSIGFHYKRADLVFRVNNIFNKYYNSYASAITVGSTTTEYYYPADGRNYMLTLNLNLE